MVLFIRTENPTLFHKFSSKDVQFIWISNTLCRMFFCILYNDTNSAHINKTLETFEKYNNLKGFA